MDHNEILHTSRQLHCRDVYNISLWSVEYILNHITAKNCRISNSIEISLVGQALGPLLQVAMRKWYIFILNTLLQTDHFYVT